MSYLSRLITPRSMLSRRTFVTGAASGGALIGLGLSSKEVRAAVSGRQPIPLLSGSSFDINIGYKAVNFTGRERPATAFNGSVPGPVVRWREGDRVTLRVTN